MFKKFLTTLLLVFSFLYGQEYGEETIQQEEVEKQKEKKEFKRPKFKTRRFEESWQDLQEYDDTEDFFDPIKYIPLNEDGSIWASMGGQARIRMEMWNNFGFDNDGDRDDVFWLTRLFLHTEVNFGPFFRVFVEGKSSFAIDRDLPMLLQECTLE